MGTFFYLSHHGGDVFRESEKDSGMSSRGKAGTETILLGSAQTAEQKPKKERESGSPCWQWAWEFISKCRRAVKGQDCQGLLLSDHQCRGPQARMHSTSFLSQLLDSCPIQKAHLPLCFVEHQSPSPYHSPKASPAVCTMEMHGCGSEYILCLTSATLSSSPF